jgi:RimJ/RimL family protein N-acetyltransferase
MNLSLLLAVVCNLPRVGGRAVKITVNEQIYLSPITASDQDACVEHLKEKEIYNWTSRIPFPYSAADFRNWLQYVEQSTQQQGREVQWAIRNFESYLIGVIGFLDGWQLGKSHRAEIGYWLGKPFWGQGIMTHVIRTVCDYAFTEFGLRKITADVYSNNAASARVLEKCGFVQEGYLRQHYLKDGELRDAKTFGLLKAD